jgi:HK97 family phage portal protein
MISGTCAPTRPRVRCSACRRSRTPCSPSGWGSPRKRSPRSSSATTEPPSGLLTADQRLTREQAEELAETWHAKFGSRRAAERRTAVLGSGTTWQAVSVAPEESQFLDTLRFNVAQVCRIYGVPPEMIAAASGDSLTYANVEQRSLDFLTYAIGPWLTRLETALTDLVARGTFVKFNSGALLRTALKDRYESYEIGLRAGFLTVDEVRQLEDREPLPAAAPPRIEAVA